MVLEDVKKLSFDSESEKNTKNTEEELLQEASMISKKTRGPLAGKKA